MKNATSLLRYWAISQGDPKSKFKLLEKSENILNVFMLNYIVRAVTYTFNCYSEHKYDSKSFYRSNSFGNILCFIVQDFTDSLGKLY